MNLGGDAEIGLGQGWRDERLGKQIAQLSEQLGAAKEHRSGLISRQNLLKDLEAKREGVSEGVKSVLRERETRFPFVRGLVADEQLEVMLSLWTQDRPTYEGRFYAFPPIDVTPAP